jgi:hypothetical protein
LAFTSNPNRLIVEGHEDRQSVAALMGEYTPWPQDKYKAPVWIDMCNGSKEILKDGFLSVQIKNPETRTLGVVLDADTKPASSQYSRVASLCADFFDFPEAHSASGTIVGKHSKRFGLWIMPDNSGDGDMETFLKYLVPAAAKPSWDYAVGCVTRARQDGSPCRDVHVAKANLYTWLAWQDPPSQSPGRALTQKILDPALPYAESFVKWFMELYQLPGILT